MADIVRMALVDMARGLRDSLAGTLKVWSMDQAKDQSSGESEESSDKPLSTLARRRAERMKHKHTKKSSVPKVQQRILLCCAWNGLLFWLSIFLFNEILIPCLEFLTQFMFAGSSTHNHVWSYIGPILRWTFRALWILPLFLLSKIINCFWFQDIAHAAYRQTRGRPQMFSSLGKVVADVLFSILLQSLFMIQASLAGTLPVPVVGDVLYMLHMALLNSLYAFEYKWFNMGWEVNKRLTYIQSNWPYFVGFGLPLAYFTSVPSSFAVSGCVFSILFPLFIISGNEAEPLPRTFPFPLRLFSPVVFISDAAFSHSLKKTKPAVDSAAVTGTTH